jgi:hypothetical protein
MMGLGRPFWRGSKAPKHRSGRRSGAEKPWVRRQARGLLPDRNPLRRRIDRVEAYLLAGLFVAAATGAPLAAQAASRAAYSGALRTQQEQLATRQQVKAKLTEPAGSSMNGYTLSEEVPTSATWKSATGVPGSGHVLAESGRSEGSVVIVWTTPNGHQANPPLTAAQVAGQGDAGALGAVAGVIVAFLTGTGVVRYVMYRRRMAAWEADWLLTAPTWNRQSW